MTPQDQAGGFAGIGMISSLFGGISQYKEGQTEKSAYDYNADITLQNMRAQMVASQQKYSQLVGRQASSYARAGVDIASGSPLLVMAATAGRGGQEAEQIEQAGTEEANLQRYYGRLAAWKGTISGIDDFLGGMTSTLTNLNKMFPSATTSPGAAAGAEGVMGQMGGTSLPIVQPVQKPTISVGEMRHAGLDAAVDANRVAEQIASAGMQVEDRLIQAKRQLDVKQGEIAFDKYQQQTEADLAKTVSTEDVDALFEHYQNNAPQVTTPYAKDPRVAQALNLYTQSRSVDMQSTVNARKAKIITDQDLAANELKGEKSTEDWKNAFLSGGDVSLAEGEEKLTLQSSVLHGTMTQAHADLKFQEWLLKTKQSAIEGMMNSSDPVQRRKFIDQLKSGNMPKELSGLDRGFLNQALTAAEGKDAELRARSEAQDVNAKFNNSLGEFKTHPDLYPTPELKSAAYGNPDFLKSIGAVTPEGQPDFVAGQKLRSLYTPLGADEKTQAKVKVDKEFDDVSKLVAENKLGQAQVMLDKYRPDFEALDASFYRAGETAIRQRIDFNEQQERFGRQESRWEAEEKGKQSFSRLMQNVADNKPIDFGKDILPLLIAGEITPTQVRQAMAISTMSQKDRGVQMGLKLIQSSAQFTAGTDETNLQMAELGFAYTDMVQQHGIKGKDAIDLAASMRDEAAKKSVHDAINDAFSWRPGLAVPPQPSLWNRLLQKSSGAFEAHTGPLPGKEGETKQPKVVERRVTKSGKVLEKLDDGTIREGKGD